MLRTLLALAAGGLVFTGPAAAFNGWFYCPPRYYTPPPVVYYYPVYVVPMGCPPVVPAPGSTGTTVPGAATPKPMPGGEAPAAKGKDEKKSGLTPAEFTDRPRKSEVELATPSAAPPPIAEVKLPDPKPATVPETKIEPPVAPTPKVIDVPLPSVIGETPKPNASDVSIPPVTPTEPGKIPPLTVPVAAPKVDAAPVGAGVVRPDSPSGGLQIPPIDLPVPSVPPEKKSISKSSPLSTEQSVTVRTVAGSPPASGRYTVRFFNHTASAFRLTVESGSIELPAKHFVDVSIGRAFTWRAGEGNDRRTEVPADAAGLEIAVKE